MITKPTPEHQARIDEAIAAREDARENLRSLQTALSLAESKLSLAEGRLHLVKDAPTWKDILRPGVLVEERQLYTYCMQLGYSYAVFNGKIYKAGSPSEQMIYTGATEEDIQ